MSVRGAQLAALAAAGAFLAAGCGDEGGSKYDRQYPAPQNEQNMMKVLRTDTTRSPAPARSKHERKESDTR